MPMKYLIECEGVAAFIEMQRGDSSAYYGKVQNAFQAAAGKGDGRFAYVAMIRMDNPETACGVPYSWGLANADGAWFELLSLPPHDATALNNAKAKIRRDQDVVTMRVRRVERLIEFEMPPRETQADVALGRAEGRA